MEAVAVWTDEPTVVWRKPVSNSYSSPVVSDGLVFIHGKGEGDSEEMLAFNSDTGEQVWRDTYPREKYSSRFGSGPRSTPTVSDGKLFTYGITGILSCYDAKTGQRKWQTNPYEASKTALPRWGCCSSPAVVDGRVAVLVGGVGYAFAAYDLETGELAWKGQDEPAGTASPTVITRSQSTGGGSEFVMQTTLRLIGVAAKDGKLRWEHPVVFQPAGVAPTPLAIESRLVCTTPETGTLALDILADSAKQAWLQADAGSYFSTGSVGPHGTVLVVTNQTEPTPRADLRCFDLADGKELWKHEGLGYYHFASILMSDGKLLMYDDAGNLHLAEVSRDGFKSLVKSKISRGTLTNHAFADGRVYVRDDRELICLQLPPASGSASSD